jgi:hypothetical protein
MGKIVNVGCEMKIRKAEGVAGAWSRDVDFCEDIELVEDARGLSDLSKSGFPIE